MGRTSRRRRRARRAPHSHTGCTSAALMSWLACRGARRNRKLTLATFCDTGRGVLTRRTLRPGERLLRLPLRATLNVTTLLADSTFNLIFTPGLLVRYANSLSFQSCLALYLVYLKSMQQESEWYTYLDTLPKEYTVPYYLPSDILKHLPRDLVAIVMKQKYIVDASFNIFMDIVTNSQIDDNVLNMAIDRFKHFFTKAEYEWAYFTVNTRCVYMDLSEVMNFSCMKDTFLELLNDNSNVALCPYLDMINHNHHYKNETKLIVNGGIEDINIKNLKHENFSNVHFDLYTKNYIKSYNEVFICYGDSHNLKLVTEYGFFLPNNELDCVTFDFDTMLTKCDLKLSQNQLEFVTVHGLNKHLYIDSKGLSFNLYALLMVVKCYYTENVDISKVIYSSQCSENASLTKLILPLIKDNIHYFSSEIRVLEKSTYKCVILDNCVALMCHYVHILENFIKC